MPATLTVSARTRIAGRVDVLAIPVAEGPDGPVPGAGAELAGALGVDVAAALAREAATGKAGEVVAVPAPGSGAGTATAGPVADTVLLLGVGEESPGDLRKAAAAAVRRAGARESLATTLVSGRDAETARAVAEALTLASYRFTRKRADDPPKLSRATLLVDDPAGLADALDRATATASAVALARDLANTPSLDKSPQWLAQQARGAAQRAGLEVSIRDEQALAADGFGGVLAVGAGSVRPPRLVEIRYAPPGATRHVVLVGKGITFDSGGLSLKPSDSMVPMKTDMAGAAAVIATMTALPRLGVAARVTSVTPLAENLPSGSATRPGDVIRHWGGRTSEVLNTDAEGRLVLADAIAYAAATWQPDVIVDLATLTGAATLALGRRDAALYTTTERLRDQLVAAGRASGDRLWPMPLVEDYREALESPIADQRNIAHRGKQFSGGSIIAALFLREFTDGVEWAHLDIAGPARADSDDGEISKGATGFGVRALCRWLEAL